MLLYLMLQLLYDIVPACVCVLLYVAGTGQEVQWPTRKEMVVCNQATEKGMFSA